MSEYSNKRNRCDRSCCSDESFNNAAYLFRGALVSAVFALQGLGILTAAAVTLLVTYCFRRAYPGTPYGHTVELIRGSCPPEADFVWRIVLAFGSIPALLTSYARSKMPETPRFTLRVQGNALKAARDTCRAMNGDAAGASSLPPPPPPPRPPTALSTRQFVRAWWKPLLGCAGSWFLLDVAVRIPTFVLRASLNHTTEAIPARPDLVLQPKPVPKGCVCCDWLVAGGLSHERAG